MSPPSRTRLVGLSSRWRGKDKDDARGFGWDPGMKIFGFIRDRLSSRGWRVAAVASLALLHGSVLPGPAIADPVGSVTALPLPRYASLKTDRVNLREGPSKDHATKWVFQRAGLPVEITGEFEIWRKVRDSEGAEGWVLHSLLSGRRTALGAPGKKGQTFKIFAKPAPGADLAATLQSGVEQFAHPRLDEFREPARDDDVGFLLRHGRRPSCSRGAPKPMARL